MIKRTYVKGFLNGIISGVALGVFLKIIENVTGIKVYTLLLNVDYVPVLNKVELTEWAEFTLHLIISIMLSITMQYYLQQKKWAKKEKVKLVMVVSLVIGLLLYPTTILSERTPELTDLNAFLIWMTGHGLYGVILGFLISGDEGRER